MTSCPKCNVEFDNTSIWGYEKKFCSRKCANSRTKIKKKVIYYNCLFCQKECEIRTNKFNKFCTNKCQANYKWEFETKPRLEDGTKLTTSFTIKKYLIEIRGEKCQECNLDPIWNGKYLSLQVDHIDGNSDNNHLSNVRLICPNCHTQTDTFGSKGKGSRYKKVTKRNIYLQQYKSNNGRMV